MTHYMHIGASAGDAVACYPTDVWASFVAAWTAGDHETLLRLVDETRPVLIPTAKLQGVEPPSMTDAAAAYWAKRGKTLKPRATDASGIPIVATVQR